MNLSLGIFYLVEYLAGKRRTAGMIASESRPMFWLEQEDCQLVGRLKLKLFYCMTMSTCSRGRLA